MCTPTIAKYESLKDIKNSVKPGNTHSQAKKNKKQKQSSKGNQRQFGQPAGNKRKKNW